MYHEQPLGNVPSIRPGFETKNAHEPTFTGFEGRVRKSLPQKRQHAESNWANDESRFQTCLLSFCKKFDLNFQFFIVPSRGPDCPKLRFLTV